MEDKPKRVVRLPVIQLEQLDRQVDRGALFNYSMHTSAHDRIHDLSAFVFGGLELLMAKGLITREELQRRVAVVKQELDQNHWTKQHGFAFYGDEENKYQTKSMVLIDCDARMPLCKGVCCAMDHPLQVSDVAEGVVKWDHLRPYWIRHQENHRCVHQQEAGTCDIFEQRPLVCRQFTCEHDDRIWIDFEKRIPNTAAIDAVFAGTDGRPTMVKAMNVAHTAATKPKSDK